MEKRNFQILMENQINKLESRPSLLLHSCCAPCSTAVLEVLTEHFDVTVFYYNPNISPESEFLKRAEEQIKYARKLGIDVIVPDYNDGEFFDAVKGLEGEPEGGARCRACFEQRLDFTAKYAKEHGFDYFTTTLSVSPHKNAEVLNSVCEAMAEKYGITNLYGDFKKKNGYKRSCELSAANGLYRQDYCGCVFSKAQRHNTVL